MFKQKKFPCEKKEMSFNGLVIFFIFIISAVICFQFMDYLNDRDQALMESAQRYEECIEHQYDGMHPVEVYHLNNGVWPECDYEKTKTN